MLLHFNMFYISKVKYIYLEYNFINGNLNLIELKICI